MSKNEKTKKFDLENDNNDNFSEKISKNNNESLEYESFSDELSPSDDNKNQMNEDTARITVLESELERTKDQMIRALAEAENSRKRAQKDREDASKFAVTSFAKDLLSVADNLRRALDAIPENLMKENEQVKNLTDGIEATERELLRSFDKNGIQKIEPLDEPFNPNFHEVMFEAPIPDKPAGTVIQILEPGYIINGRILRPARVGIAKGGSEEKNEPPTKPGQNINTEA